MRNQGPGLAAIPAVMGRWQALCEFSQETNAITNGKTLDKGEKISTAALTMTYIVT